MDYAASNSSELKVFFAKSRSPTRRSTEEADRLTEDILQPLVAGDEFEEEEFEGNTDISIFSYISIFFRILVFSRIYSTGKYYFMLYMFWNQFTTIKYQDTNYARLVWTFGLIPCSTDGCDQYQVYFVYFV